MTDDYRIPNVSPDVLSPTELQVAKLLAAGCSISQIAGGLNVSAQIVKSHCKAICAKLGTDDQVMVVRWAVRFDVGRW
jgi:DNA-binding CsgD family transcriptional regulator